MFALLSRDNCLSRNTLEISEISENHLKAIVYRRQVAGRDRFRQCAGKVAERTRGEEKAAKIRSRGWRSAAASADYMDLRGDVPAPSPDARSRQSQRLTQRQRQRTEVSAPYEL